MDYKIEILETLNLIKVTTKFDTYGGDINKIEGVTNFNWVSRYKFTVEIGEMFTCEEVVKNIQKHLDGRDNESDESKTKIDVSNDFTLERMASTFKGELYRKEDKKSWWTFIKNLWKGENGKKVGVKWPL